MNEQFSLIPGALAQKLAVAEIIRCNQTTSRYGLVLKESDARELADTRSEALEKLGRIEFAGGSINKLILEFCDSPYLNQANYSETLNELVQIFYYFKNETLDEVDDDDLIISMKKYFDETCRGSLDLLETRDLENLARKIRYGFLSQEDYSEDIDDYSEEHDDFTDEFFSMRREFEAFEEN
jgi:DNA mismatch repair ATPase MutS